MVGFKPTTHQVIYTYNAYEDQVASEKHKRKHIREKDMVTKHWREKTQKLFAMYFGVGEWPPWVSPSRFGICEPHHISRYANGETAYNDCGWAFSLQTASPKTIEHAIKGE